MGGLKSLVNTTYLNRQAVTIRAAQTYTAAAHNLFTITGGPVWIKALFFHATQAITSGATMTITICGVAADSAVPTAIATVIGGNCVWPLQGANPPVPNVLSNPMPTLAAALVGSFGQLASPGGAGGDDITVTVGTAATDGNCTFYVVYYAMNPASLIVVA